MGKCYKKFRLTDVKLRNIMSLVFDNCQWHHQNNGMYGRRGGENWNPEKNQENSSESSFD
jgi:hypothetical protein